MLTLARELHADVYSTNIDREKIAKMGFQDITLKSIGRIPLNPPFRQQFACWKFRALNLKNKYDFYIVGGDWCISGAVKNKPNLVYIHSPVRELWDLYQATRKNNVPWLLRPVFDMWVAYNRRLSREHIKHATVVACNARNTQRRIRKYLRRDATVVHPPIETSQFHYARTGDYWLSVNRLITHKRVDMQMKAFARLPQEKLIVVGCYEQSRHFKAYARYINQIKPDNVEIISWVDFSTLVKLYANCKGFITTSKDEDFGMTPVEAMASGKPVIAPKEGGYRETVLDGKTGKLIDDITVDKLVRALKEVGGNPRKYRKACLKQAKQFDTKVFIRKIRRLLP